jgi:hypothetical protein
LKQLHKHSSFTLDPRIWARVPVAATVFIGSLQRIACAELRRWNGSQFKM